MVFLSQEFLSKYGDVNPFKNPMSEFVYLRTYSRWLEDKGRRETWLETCQRVVNYSFALYSGPKGHEELVPEAEKMFDDVFNLRYLPAGRTLWVGGTEIIEHVSEANFNCSFTAIEKIQDIKDLFYLLMVGTGVGFSVEKKYVAKLPKFNNKIKLTMLDYQEKQVKAEKTSAAISGGIARIYIGDSREGWADGLEEFLRCMTQDISEIVVSLDNVRPKGSRLKRFGGKASGPEPYAQMISKMHEVIVASNGTLKPVDVLDICNIAAENVVAGGVRRSAQIALMDPDEDEAIYAKKGYWLTGKYHRAMSNNSISFWEKPSKEYLGKLIESIKESYEPGFINAEASSKRRPWYHGTNPCVTADTWVLTEMGPRQVKDLIGVQHGTYVNGELFSTTDKGFWKTGHKKVFKIKTKEGFELRLTDNHQIKKVTAQTQKKQYTDWVETKDLKPGDMIRLHNHRGIQPWEGEGSFDQGWLMGELIGDGTFYGEKAYLDFWGDSKMQHAERVSSSVSTKVSCHSSKVADKVRVNSKELNQLATKFGIKAVEKEVSREIEMASYDFYRGFLQGFFDADGTVLVSPEKGSSVRLSQANLGRLKAVQRMLARLGIISTIYTNRREAGFRSLPDSKGGRADYYCQEMNELVISNDNMITFHELVNFSEPSKKEKLQSIIDGYKRTPNRERFAVEIDSIIEDGYEDVYDCTVPGPAEFDANGIEAHNCAEILLTNKGFCNLSTVFVPAFINEKNELDLFGLEKTVRASARHCLRITNVDISLKEWDKNQKRDRLLGVNLTGVEDAFDRCGIEGSKRGYVFNLLRSAANDEAARYAKEMRVPTPLLVTTIQPGGTLSQLNASGPCSPGFHKSFAPFIKRTVRISAHDALAKTVLKQGYKVYPDPMSGISSAEFDAMTPANQKKCLSTVPTWVVVFGIDTGAKMKAADESAISQLERYRQYLQDYADHNVSSTIQVGDEEWDDVINWIHNNWDDYIGVSFQNKSNDKYDLPPYEAITKEEYDEIIKHCPPIDHDLLNKIENGHFSADDDLGDGCQTGACPIR